MSGPRLIGPAYHHLVIAKDNDGSIVMTDGSNKAVTPGGEE